MRTAFHYMAVTALIFCLAGCAAKPVHVDAKKATEYELTLKKRELDRQKATEEAAWRKVQTLAASQCNFKPAPPKKNEAVALSSCMSDLVKVHVIPKAAFPDIIISDRKKAQRIAEIYAQGKLTPAEYRQQSEERMKKYKTTWKVMAEQKMLEEASKHYWLGDKT